MDRNRELELVLGRPERALELSSIREKYAGARCVVTGAAGSIGAALTVALGELDADVLPTDLHPALGEIELDVRDIDAVRGVLFDEPELEVVFHLAGAKHAPAGEEDPWSVAETNVVGTRNVLDVSADMGARVVTVSTGKACDPETAYGASKLLAERMTLEAGGTVARFVNVVETSGNVFELWRAIPETSPLPVMPCARYFVSLREAVALTLWAGALEPGRYALGHATRRAMSDVAAAVYPDRRTERVKPRRGDRIVEPGAVASHEETIAVPGAPREILRVWSRHDPPASLEAIDRLAA